MKRTVEIEWWRVPDELDPRNETVAEIHKETLIEVALEEIRDQLSLGSDKGNFSDTPLPTGTDPGDCARYRGYWKLSKAD